jgi:hypothetical protein
VSFVQNEVRDPSLVVDDHALDPPKGAQARSLAGSSIAGRSNTSSGA